MTCCLHAYASDDYTLDRSRLILSFDEEFDSPVSFYNPKTGKGTWKTNFFFGDQKGYSSRTLDPDWEIFSDKAYNGVNPFTQTRHLMVITVAKNKDTGNSLNHGKRYTAGMLTTEKSFQQTYGYFEVKVALPSGIGLWPAFWMLSTTRGSNEEIDCMENLGKDSGTVYCSIHKLDVAQPINVTHPITIGTATSMHTYGVLWTATDLIWYIDDKEVARSSNPGLKDPMYLLVTIGVGGSWGGYPNSTTKFPSQMRIEHVRVYSFNRK
ncbi:MAG: glycoside hydrolase family 16 protein [Methylacidiphilales bacterium]|nr:glycoside hydrolase family 16 protein [Candidatus Methylacidiphilales bacterium]